jgi:riboflavin biosynthesis pyrimidine reductase
MAGRNAGLAIEPLWHDPEARPFDPGTMRGGLLPPELSERFPGELAVNLRPDRASIIANFVSSIDGVVALGPTEPNAGGGEISGFSEVDRFMMALLRGVADVVIIGAGTVRVGAHHEWTPRHVQPKLAGAFAAWRREMGLAPQPTTIVVTASGNVNADHPGLDKPDVPVILATTRSGATRLSALPFASNVRVVAVSDERSVPAAALVDVVRDLGARVALCEGGPHLFGEMLRARLIDELFLTLAPQAIGRDDASRRLGLIEGTSFVDEQGRWANLEAVRHAGGDLFLRYRFPE